MKNIFYTISASLAVCLTQAARLSASFNEAHNSTSQPRAADTCGDPSVAMTYYTGTFGSPPVHGINTQPAFVNRYTLGGGWGYYVPSFKAWLSPGQINTVPLYASEAADVDFTYSLTPGTAIVGYVYASQICNSVPLYGGAHNSPGDHWYTTSLEEHNQLIGFGWVDLGIVAYVLPIDDCGCSS